MFYTLGALIHFVSSGSSCFYIHPRVSLGMCTRKHDFSEFNRGISLTRPVLGSVSDMFGPYAQYFFDNNTQKGQT